MKISAIQIDEILSEHDGVLIRRSTVEEDLFVAQIVKDDGFGRIVAVESDSGPDIGELVNELHSRL